MERPFKPPRGCKPQVENYCSSLPFFTVSKFGLSLAEGENAEVSHLVHAQASVSCEPLDWWPQFKGRAVWFGVYRKYLGQVNSVRVIFLNYHVGLWYHFFKNNYKLVWFKYGLSPSNPC